MAMTRTGRVPGEKPLFWVGSAKSDLVEFPEAVKDALGVALSVAQFGGKHPHAKPWKGEGPGVMEIVEDYRSDTYRAVYTVNLRRPSTCCTPSRKSRREAQEPHTPTWN
jgi:phage-related protein